MGTGPGAKLPLRHRRAQGHTARLHKGLHDAFKRAMEQESHVTALARYDMVPMYVHSATYLKFAQDTFAKEKALVEKLGLLRQP